MTMLAMLAATAPAGTPDPPRTVLDGVISLGGVIILVGLVSSVTVILRALKANRLENEKALQEREDRFMGQIDKHNDSVEDRLKTLEVTCRDFMPRREIEAKIDHEKSNRVAGQEGMIATQRDQARTLGDIQKEQARFGAQLEASTGTVAKLEATIDRFVVHVNERLDKISDCVTAISRKVG
jgi:hypothetical protein